MESRAKPGFFCGMKKIAVFTSGGDAPGMNACIRAAVRTGVYYGVEVYGIMHGYDGMIKGEIMPMPSNSVANIIQRGGTILKSARSLEFKTKEGRQRAYNNLKHHGIEGLVCIGGDGTFTGAAIFHEEFGIPCMGAPGTIDNDLGGTDYTIGFDTAVNTALNAIDRIRDTADSHNRTFFVEVMGRHSGAIALDVALSCGAEAVMLPEVDEEIEFLNEHFNKENKRRKTFSIIIVAEGDEEGGAIAIANRFKQARPDMDIKVTILGHIQRGGAPSSNDRILATRLGAHAVKSLLEGHTNKMVGVMNQKIVLTDFKTAITEKKSLNPDMLKLMQVVNI